eukprot:13958579-Ditylum_brightwellii.AAC.1
MATAGIWGPDVGCLQGKTVHRPGIHARPITLGIPPHIIQNHMNVTVVADILNVNGMTFFYPCQED